MKIIINFLKGISSTRKASQMVLLLFIINLLFAAILAVPMYNSLKDSFGTSLVGERMAQGFDYIWWGEYRDSSTGLEKAFTPSIIGKGAILNNLQGLVQMRFFNLPSVIPFMGLIYIILHTFLAGGILSIFVKETPKFSMKEFFNGAGTYFLRFFLLMLISWSFFIAILIFLNGGFYTILQNVRQDAVSEVPPFYLSLLFNVIIFILVLFIQMVFDYSRIKIVVEENRNVIKSALGAFGFVFKHIGSTMGLYYLILIAHVIVTLIYILLKTIIPQSAYLGVVIAFLIQQIFIFTVIGIRCWFYSSQLELYRYLK